MQDSTSKYTNDSKEKVEQILNIAKKNIQKDNFIVCTNLRNIKNRKFIEKYRLDSNKQKQMLLAIGLEDFCYSVDNYNNPQERLYIFSREYDLDNWGTIEKVEVYIKIAIKEKEFTVIISLHELEKKINKIFK